MHQGIILPFTNKTTIHQSLISIPLSRVLKSELWKSICEIDLNHVELYHYILFLLTQILNSDLMYCVMPNYRRGGIALLDSSSFLQPQQNLNLIKKLTTGTSQKLLRTNNLTHLTIQFMRFTKLPIPFPFR
jgi:hypothetical protein